MLNDSWCNTWHQICTRNLNRKVVETVITSFKKFRIATRRTEAVVTVILSRDSKTLPLCSVQSSRLSYSSTECLFWNSRWGQSQCIPTYSVQVFASKYRSNNLLRMALLHFQFCILLKAFYFTLYSWSSQSHEYGRLFLFLEVSPRPQRKAKVRE
jgi:hypothetical protein